MTQNHKTVLNNGDETVRLQKRKADEAFFGRQSISDQSSIVSKRPSNKVVDFHDDDYDDKVGHSHGRPVSSMIVGDDGSSNIGRLKRRAQTLLATRHSLPIFPHGDEVRAKLKDHDVLLLVGETGSGKSTQIPQFLLDQPYTRRTLGKSNSARVGGCIAITQPRRVAAISLARRVAEEMGTPLGNSSPASQVGYSVRFDNSTGPNTRVKFLTDGMLLQEMLRDPWLKEYSVVVVDEVHERGVNVDLVLGFLKRIMEGREEGDGRGGVPLKVVVMSATADMEGIERFLLAGEEVDGHANGANKASANDEGEDEGENFEGFSDDGASKSKSNQVTKSPASFKTQSIRLTSCFIKGRQYPVKINYTLQPVASSWDAALERIIQIHQHTPLPGDILVFLPGQEAIDSLESMCTTYANNLFQQSKQKGAPNVPKLLILPLFAALPTAAQQRVFESTPSFTRKIILSTNIAETSVTVPGIRHVIDTGKRKARFFRPALNLDTLLTKSISRSSAKQRAGRAGREAAGSCWRLYTEKTFYELEADTEPEILRCDLSQLVLTLKAHNIDDILSFPLLTQPPTKALERALLHLLQLKALHPKTGHITDLGRRMSSLPLPANLARVLLASTELQYDCLSEMIDIVSGLSVENIWLPIHNGVHAQQNSSENSGVMRQSNDADLNEDDDDATNPIEIARRTLYRRSGDHLTLLAAIRAYVEENSDRKAWCRRHGISHRAMSAAMDVRKQLTKLMAVGGRYRPGDNTHHPNGKNKSKPSNIQSKDDTTPAANAVPNTNPATSSTTTSEPSEPRILKCLLTGLHPNTARLNPQTHVDTSSSSSSNASTAGPYKTYYTSKPLTIHPSSVLFSREKGSRATDIMFSEFVFTARPYARCVSAVEGTWIEGVMADAERDEGG